MEEKGSRTGQGEKLDLMQSQQKFQLTQRRILELGWSFKVFLSWREEEVKVHQ